MVIPGQFKRYTRPYDEPQGLTGGMASLPSRSLSQPGGTVPAPRAVPQGLGIPPGTRAPTIGPQLGGTPEAILASGFAMRQGGQELSPYEEEYRQGARGWEGLRNQLAQQVQGLVSPQAYAHAGLPSSYWKGQADKRMGELSDQVTAKRNAINAAFRAGNINSAQRDVELERLERTNTAERAKILAEVEGQKMQMGFQAAQAGAGTLGALYGQVPVAAAPQALSMGSIEGLPGLGVRRGGNVMNVAERLQSGFGITPAQGRTIDLWKVRNQ